MVNTAVLQNHKRTKGVRPTQLTKYVPDTKYNAYMIFIIRTGLRKQYLSLQPSCNDKQ